jgi:hypothetical protein
MESLAKKSFLSCVFLERKRMCVKKKIMCEEVLFMEANGVQDIRKLYENIMRNGMKGGQLPNGNID